MMLRNPRWAALSAAVLTALLGVVSSSTELLAQEQPGEALSAEALVGKMAEAFAAVKTLEVSGTTTVEQRAGGRTQGGEESFEMALRRADRLRFSSRQQGGGFLAVWDGTTGWLSATHENQYQKHEGIAGLEEFLSGASALTGLGNFPLSYAHDLLQDDPKAGIMEGVTKAEVESAPGSQTYHLVLRHEAGEVVTLVMGRDDFLLRSTAFDLTPAIRKSVEAQGRPVPDDLKVTVTVTFTDTKTNKPLADSLFLFTPPEGFALVTQFGPQPLTGKPAPDFSFSSLGGQRVTLSALKGKVVLVDFWATWCGPCRIAMPHLEKLHQEFGEEGLVVLGVTNEDAGTVRPFVEENKVTFTILLDPQGTSSRAYRVQAIPRTLIIDREGKVHADFTGVHPEETLRATLAELGIK